MRVGSTVSYLHSDYLGSASLATDANGAVVANSATRYYPYGGTRSGGSGLPTDRRFTGQRQEAALGLYDYGARYYDPLIGRFIQADTIVPNPSNPQSLNRYTYVRNNPLRYTDPTGHMVACGCTNEGCGTGYTPPPPPPPQTYDPAESVQQAWGLVWDWLSGTGQAAQDFGPESSLTQDIMYDPGMEQFREKWAAKGYPLPWKWQHSADEREGGWLPIRVVKGVGVYAREHLVELPLATMGRGSETPEGRIDPVGGTIGSLDEIRVYDAGNGMVKIEVYNEMSLTSVTRLPGTNFSFIPFNLPRNPGPSQGLPGSTIVQYFYWWEPMP